MWMIVIIVLGVIGAGVMLVVLAARAWTTGTHEALEQLVSAPRWPVVVRSARDPLAGLPPPVARYLRLAVPERQPLIIRAELQQHGSFLMAPPTGWRPFSATHTATVAPAGFVWDARISAAPGATVFVRDGFVRGEGRMHASFMGVVPIVNVHGTRDIAAGALLRWLAEAVWYPTALLPGEGVDWTALSGSSARATVREGGTIVALDFHFGSDGLVGHVYARARGRFVKGVSVPTPWQGRFTHYERHSGMLIPVVGEVEWLSTEGALPYWRGQLDDVRFQHA